MRSLRARDQIRSRTLGDSAGEESLGGRSRHQGGDGGGSGGFTENRDFFRIPTEGGDVALHPLQGRDLIAQPEVGVEYARPEERSVGKESVSTCRSGWSPEPK